MWHSLHDIWLCPTKNDIRTAAYLQSGPLAWYLFPNTLPSTVSSEDVCPFCGYDSEDIFQEFNEDLYECFADWEIRVKHLERYHNFDKCEPNLRFYKLDQFLLHLSGCHNLRLSKWTKEVIDSCQREAYVRGDYECFSGQE
jgi:hypothetical protein